MQGLSFSQSLAFVPLFLMPVGFSAETAKVCLSCNKYIFSSSPNNILDSCFARPHGTMNFLPSEIKNSRFPEIAESSHQSPRCCNQNKQPGTLYIKKLAQCDKLAFYGLRFHRRSVLCRISNSCSIFISHLCNQQLTIVRNQCNHISAINCFVTFSAPQIGHHHFFTTSTV